MEKTNESISTDNEKEKLGNGAARITVVNFENIVFIVV